MRQVPSIFPYMIYKTESDALSRIAVLRATAGIWPGVIKVTGGYRLTYDPPSYLDVHGYLPDPS